MARLAIILLDGTVFAAVLFLISVGLTLVFGVLRILNIAPKRLGFAERLYTIERGEILPLAAG